NGPDPSTGQDARGPAQAHLPRRAVAATRADLPPGEEAGAQAHRRGLPARRDGPGRARGEVWGRLEVSRSSARHQPTGRQSIIESHSDARNRAISSSGDVYTA